jgi:F0F1-type ATP synthase membrane subunit b/b'
VVVVNFLNKKNAADQRVYQLLDEKFRLFNGVFGASDEVLGAIESGVDFEKRIASIYQKCRSPQQIAFEFDELQKELETEVDDAKSSAREKLLNNFDQEVIEKVKVDSTNYLGKLEERLWKLTRYALKEHADFNDKEMSFKLRKNPFDGESIHSGPYRLAKKVVDANTYRIGHPLAQRIIQQSKETVSPNALVEFNLSGSGKNISILKDLVGKTGWARCIKQSITAFELEEHILFAGMLENGTAIDEAQCARLFDLDGVTSGSVAPNAKTTTQLDKLINNQSSEIIATMSQKNGVWFDAEMEKLDKWAEDKRNSLKNHLKELDDQLKETKKLIRQAGSLPDKLELQKKARKLEQKRDESWKEYDDAAKELANQKDQLIDKVEARLKQQITTEELFTIQFKLN